MLLIRLEVLLSLDSFSTQVQDALSIRQVHVSDAKAWTIHAFRSWLRPRQTACMSKRSDGTASC